MRTGKNFRIWGVRGSLIGDSIMALPVYAYIEKRFPNSYRFWQVAKKCAQAAPLYFNHPLIDQVVISDCEEGMGPRDIEIAKTCEIVFNVMPDHPLEQDWPNHRSIGEETFLMAGLPLSEYHALSPDEQRPQLVRWFNVDKRRNTIAIWPCAGYGGEMARNPTAGWYKILVAQLKERGYDVLQFGHPKDFCLDTTDLRHLSFFDQVKMTLGCDLVISTDSGSGLIFGAYSMPQVTILTNHFPSHTRNLTALAPLNPNGHCFVSVGGTDKISQDEATQKVVDMAGKVG